MTATMTSDDVQTQDIIDAVVNRHEAAPAPIRRSFQSRQKPSPAILKPLTKSVSAAMAEVVMATPKTDHINALEKTSTGIEQELGHFLGIDSATPFYHPDFACTFESIRGIYGAIKDPARLDFFRRSSGAACRNAIFEIKDREFIPNFRQAIAEAVWYKVLSYPDMAKKMAETTATFTNYYYRRGPGGVTLTSSTPESSWFILILEEIRDTLKMRENESDDEKKAAIEPDFSALSPNNMFRNRH